MESRKNIPQTFNSRFSGVLKDLFNVQTDIWQYVGLDNLSTYIMDHY